MNNKLKAAKGLNLAAGVLDIIAGVGALIGALLFLFTTVLAGAIGSEVTDAAGGGEGILAGVMLIMVLFVLIYALEAGCFLGFGISTARANHLDGKAYCAKKGKFLGFLITEIVLLVLAVIAVVLSFDIIQVVILSALALIVVLRIVGYALTRVAEKELDAAPAAKVEPVKAEANEEVKAEVNEEVASEEVNE